MPGVDASATIRDVCAADTDPPVLSAVKVPHGCHGREASAGARSEATSANLPGSVMR
jgi:hypothetical protein